MTSNQAESIAKSIRAAAYSLSVAKRKLEATKTPPPHLLDEMRREHDHLFTLYRHITGEQDNDR